MLWSAADVNIVHTCGDQMPERFIATLCEHAQLFLSKCFLEWICENLFTKMTQAEGEFLATTCELGCLKKLPKQDD